MKQRINLYSFTVSQSVWRQYSPFPQIAVGLLLVALLLTLLAVMDKNKLDDELRRLVTQREQMEQQIEQLAALNNEAVNEALQQEVVVLETQLAVRQATMESITAQGAANNTGFSPYLQGLAKQHFEGLWLTSIELVHGGERMGIQGFALQPELVPRYIRKLRNEAVFTGTEFDIFSLERPADNSPLAFDVAAVVEAKQ